MTEILTPTTKPIGNVPFVPEAQSEQAAAADVSDRMVASRLGPHTGLFFALRAKHPPTAAHSLRVAIGCSKFGVWRGLEASELATLEVASLLHDVGKIGVPDGVLQKPTALTEKEQLLLSTQLSTTRELLRGAGASRKTIDIIVEARKSIGSQMAANMLEGARMLAILDAFDSMINDQAFRPALSRDRALEELFANAGSQFDATMVRDFAELISQPRPELEAQMAQHWLTSLKRYESPGFDNAEVSSLTNAAQVSVERVFHSRLLDTLSDGAVYLDRDGAIINWNRAAEQLTGRRASSLVHRRWTAELMGLQDQQSQPLTAENCPLAKLIATNTLVCGRYYLQTVAGRQLTVQVRAIPVITQNKERCGAILLVRDASTQADLEQKVQSLHTIATQDPLTKVANRAELDRRLPLFLKQHLEEGCPGSLVICDIDYFKKINDTFGHQAGDDALVTFAGLLKELAREDDLVARFGGEEFIVICSGCDNASATARAEEMRRSVEKTPVPSLKGRCMTSSFGVTEIQPGDNAETLLARADRALMMAKENGRNRVVQLGAGQDSAVMDTKPADGRPAAQKTGWFDWFRGAGESLVQADYLASVPHDVAIQKLEGFINDHKAELVSIENSVVVIRVDGENMIRRSGERPTSMVLNIEIKSVEVCVNSGRQKAYQSRTMFSVVVQPYRARDRRSGSLEGQASQLLKSFQAYLVAQEVDDELRQLIIEPR